MQILIALKLLQYSAPSIPKQCHSKCLCLTVQLRTYNTCLPNATARQLLATTYVSMCGRSSSFMELTTGGLKNVQISLNECQYTVQYIYIYIHIYMRMYVHIVLYLYEQEFTCHEKLLSMLHSLLIYVLPANLQYRKNQHTRGGGGILAGVFASPTGSMYPSYRMYGPHARPHAHAHHITSSHVRSFSTFQGLLQRQPAAFSIHHCITHPPLPAACLSVSP